MNNINWKIRFKNPLFYWSLVLTIVAPVATNLGVNLEDLTSWSIFWELVKDVLGTPYIVISIIINIFFFFIDPTTKGISDSQRALTYQKPKED